VSIWLVVALFIGFAIGRASMAREIAEHDHAFNENLRRLVFRFARAAYPKQKRSKVIQ
jgi:hypothetical protein